MKRHIAAPLSRRSFIRHSLGAGAALGALAGPQILSFAQGDKSLRAGEATVDSTPPKGIELAGFHYPVGGNPRFITDIRQPTGVRALVLQQNLTQVAILSIDILAVTTPMAERVQQAVEAKTGIPAANVRLCATHSHSMPTFAYLRQWGTVPEEYMKSVEAKAVEAVTLAQADCAEAVMFTGGSQAEGGNFNRTVKGSKTDKDFTPESTDDERWLDTLLQVLYFERGAGKTNILWYHFSSHPVCYADGLAGPDWPGLVAQRVQENFKMTPSFLQGHAGDVNPGDGVKWIGEPEPSANAVYAAVDRAMAKLEKVDVDVLRSMTRPFEMPLDIALYQQWLKEYEAAPDKCNNGNWVDAGFAKDWFEATRAKAWTGTTLPAPISCIQLGNTALAFHASELYSFYGLDIRHKSPFEHTIVVGYADGALGYVTDPKSYDPADGGNYGAVVVPKILDLPPFTRETGRALTAGLGALLRDTAV